MERIGAFMLMQGGCDEIVHFWCGCVDLSSAGATTHGLHSEGEDTRVSVVAAEDAFRMVAGNRIENAPAALSLLWLQVNRARLREEWSTTDGAALRRGFLCARLHGARRRGRRRWGHPRPHHHVCPQAAASRAMPARPLAKGNGFARPRWSEAVKGEAGTVRHTLAPGAALPPVGTEVSVELDWARRHRHMRMHTTMHLLCSLLPGIYATGNQIGAEKSRLDFDLPEPPTPAWFNERLNALIAADHPIGTRWIAEAELDANPALVRTLSVQPPRGAGRIRLVRIGPEDAPVDLQPCGGTHVRSTAESAASRSRRSRARGSRTAASTSSSHLTRRPPSPSPASGGGGRGKIKDPPPMPPLISTADLAAALGAPDLVLLDCTKYLPNEPLDGRAEFLKARIPGARFLDIDEAADPDDPLPHMVPTPARFAKVIGALGVSNASRVVLYDQKGVNSAPRGWWLLRLFGQENAAVLDGGLPKWKAEGRPLDSGEPPAVTPATFTPDLIARRLAGIGDVKRIVRQAGARRCSSTPAPRAASTARRPSPAPACLRPHARRCQPAFTELLNPDGTMKDRPRSAPSTPRAAWTTRGPSSPPAAPASPPAC
jgi:misacylated tRNA(Ala) deacylase